MLTVLSPISVTTLQVGTGGATVDTLAGTTTETGAVSTIAIELGAGTTELAAGATELLGIRRAAGMAEAAARPAKARMVWTNMIVPRRIEDKASVTITSVVGMDSRRRTDY